MAARFSGKVIRAGMDEAGYAPVLGPFVVTAVALDVPAEMVDSDLWEVLNHAVYRTGESASQQEKVQVDDSKLIKSGSKGFMRLERSVLAVLGALGLGAKSSWKLMETLAGVDYHRFAERPWYWPGDFVLPINADRDEVARLAGKLRGTLDEAGIENGRVLAEVVFADELNRSCLKTDNKAVVLAQAAAKHLAALYGNGAKMRITIDKHGGRDHYDAFLAGVFPFVPIRVVEEGSLSSRYVVGEGERRAEIEFRQGADRADFAAAVASMVSKYLRELFMKAFNIFWRTQVPGIKPTAGYPVDARRFLYETRLARKKLGIKDDKIIRAR